jgi:large subunit ribosomal protein L9
LGEPIKSLGEFKIPIKLHPEITAEVQLIVSAEKTAEEAEYQEPAAEVTTEAPEEELMENAEESVEKEEEN